jgi:kynurenine formamidase
MTFTSAAPIAVVLAVFASGGQQKLQDILPPPSIIDLGHPLSATDPTWSGKPAFTHKTSTTENGIFIGSFETDEHFGTHVDAPAHFVPGGWTIDQIPPIRFVRPAVRIDLRARVLKNEDYRMTREDIVLFERKNGAIAPGTIVLVMTGWDARWSDPARYRNEHDGALHFPGLSVEAAETLVQRDIAAIGIDTPSVDYGPSTAYEVHHTTLPHQVYNIENVANLLAVPTQGFSVVIAPANVKGGSGAPARIFAIVRP